MTLTSEQWRIALAEVEEIDRLMRDAAWWADRPAAASVVESLLREADTRLRRLQHLLDAAGIAPSPGVPA